MAKETLAQPRSGEKLRRRFAVAACAALLAICGAMAAMARGAAQKQAAPFRAGEVLNYRVEWSAFSNAASVALSIPERRNLYGWETWHFRAAIHTLGSVRSLFEVDDQFDSYSDAATLETRQFEEHLSELGRKEDDVLHFAATGEESRGPGPTLVVLPGTRDPLDVLYDLRAIDWDHTPEFRAPVYDGKNMYEMSARREDANESVTVAAGQFSTSRISIQLYQYRRLVAGLHFEIWLANDAAHTPVVMRADLPFGTIRVELISAKN
ncbi:MAG: DUF3108 domain-containing protein [Candidatus Acidiferrales bacterium]